MSRPRIGLALGGGAARGWSHIGVLRELMDAGFAPDIVAGTSIGAVAGGCYIADQLDALEEFARGLTRRRVFSYLDFNLAGSGIITGQRLCDVLEKHLKGFYIEKLARKFTAVATEIAAGHEVWLTKGKLVDAIRASYALPGIFKPVKIANRWLIDGALVNPIPVSVCRAMGANIVIAVNLNHDVFGKGTVIHDHGTSQHHEDQERLNGAEQNESPTGARKLLHRQFFGKDDGAPGISRIMIDSLNIVQDRIARARLAGDPPEFTIMPKLKDIGLFDFHKAELAIEEGRKAAKQALKDIQAALHVETVC